jgi:hypothetical protein
MSRNRRQPVNERGRGRPGSRPGAGLAGLRWVPVPLAMLLAALGFLMLGVAAGQHAAADTHAHGLEEGGLGLTVNTMLWMDSGMDAPGQPTPAGFEMPASMMPGMQTAGNQRLRIELYIRNVTTDPQRYALSDFVLVGPGGKTWKVLANAATVHSVAPQDGVLDQGFSTTVDLYFDVPAGQTKNLSVRWSHGGSTVSFPVHTSGTDSTSVMAGMSGM